MSIYPDGSNWRLIAARHELELKVQNRIGVIKNISELSNHDLLRMLSSSPTQEAK